MSTSLAHLFDYDASIINKAELVIDRLMEILNIPEVSQTKVRDQLINFVSTKAILTMIDKSSDEVKREANERLKNVDTEYFKKLAAQFDKVTLESIYNNALKMILEEKYEVIRPSINTQQAADTEQLIHSIGN